MEHVRDYLESLRSRPEYVRRRIALGTSIGATAVIFVGWAAAFASSGALALSSPAPAQDTATANLANVASHSVSDFSSLLGAASAYKTALQDGGVQIVDTKSSTTLDSGNQQPEATVIPF